MSNPAKDTSYFPRHVPVAAKTPPHLIWRQLFEASVVGSVLLMGLLASDWIASLAVLVLFAGWKVLGHEKGAPVIAAAFSAQWVQVTAGMLYFAITGRAIYQMRNSDYRPMVLIGLAAIAVLFAGFFLTAGFRRRFVADRAQTRAALPFSTRQIAIVYGITLGISGLLQEFAWSAGGLTQILLNFTRVRYLLLFFLITRLSRPKPRLEAIAAIVLLELALGFTGFFAEFREPLLIIAIAIFGAMDRRRLSTWLTIGAVTLLAVGSAVLWTAIKPIIRKSYVANTTRMERLNSAVTVASNTFGPRESGLSYQGDTLVSRLWAVYWPALALKRVPLVEPYANGAILKAAIDNVLNPRILNPNKASLPSPSDEVRKYAGVWVHGRESGTSIAFGYVGESYVDFGIPWMFVPILLYGLMLGLAYRFLTARIRHIELRTGIIIVIFWLIMGTYEASWAMMVGPAITILGVLGAAAILLDRILWTRDTPRPHAAPRAVFVRVGD